jgi:predicted ArsR family transcriptional regulator
MDKTQGIEQLFASGMSRRQIARTLEINRKSVDRHLASLESKGASGPEAPIGQAPTGSDADTKTVDKVSKGAKS